MKCIDHAPADAFRFILKLLLSIEMKTEIRSLIIQDRKIKTAASGIEAYIERTE